MIILAAPNTRALFVKHSKPGERFTVPVFVWTEDTDGDGDVVGLVSPGPRNGLCVPPSDPGGRLVCPGFYVHMHKDAIFCGYLSPEQSMDGAAADALVEATVP